MNRVDVLFSTSAVTLSAFYHPPGEVHIDLPAEQMSHDSISFVEAGRFTIRPVCPAAAPTWSLTPGMLFVAPRGREFACRHDNQYPVDRCLSVAYSTEAIEQLRIAGLPALDLTGVRATPRQRFLWRRLRALSARGRDADSALKLEWLAGTLFESVVDGRSTSSNVSRPPSGDVMRRIARVTDLIEAEYARPLALGELASTAGMSAFHFARVFGNLVGMPPHRYLITVRLREAVQRLEQGESVTRTCFAVGFCSLSHFTAMFRRRYGVLPSAITRDLARLRRLH